MLSEGISKVAAAERLDGKDGMKDAEMQFTSGAAGNIGLR